MLFDRRRYHRDNYVYLLAEGDDAALVDPGDAAVALALAAEHGVRPRFVLHTHGHHDHSGGSAEVRATLGAEVYGHRADAAWFTPDHDVAGRRDARPGCAVRLRARGAGTHPGLGPLRRGGKLLTGDTLFWGGCGNCRHGGDPARLAASFLGPIAALDGALEVHPGHDYAEANLPFALALGAKQRRCRARLEVVRAAHAAGGGAARAHARGGAGREPVPARRAAGDPGGPRGARAGRGGGDGRGAVRGAPGAARSFSEGVACAKTRSGRGCGRA